jgi:hypothetical protein
MGKILSAVIIDTFHGTSTGPESWISGKFHPVYKSTTYHA